MKIDEMLKDEMVKVRVSNAAVATPQPEVGDIVVENVLSTLCDRFESVTMSKKMAKEIYMEAEAEEKSAWKDMANRYNLDTGRYSYVFDRGKGTITVRRKF